MQRSRSHLPQRKTQSVLWAHPLDLRGGLRFDSTHIPQGQVSVGVPSSALLTRWTCGAACGPRAPASPQSSHTRCGPGPPTARHSDLGAETNQLLDRSTASGPLFRCSEQRATLCCPHTQHPTESLPAASPDRQSRHGWRLRLALPAAPPPSAPLSGAGERCQASCFARLAVVLVVTCGSVSCVLVSCATALTAVKRRCYATGLLLLVAAHARPAHALPPVLKRALC